MVRTYIRKGGHGGDRSKAGLPAGYWQEKGGRLVAPQQPQARSKGCSKSERIARGRGSKGGGGQPLEAMGQAQR